MHVLDIETIPTQAKEIRDHVVGQIGAPKNYKDPVKIKQYIEAAEDEIWRKTALAGTFGEVWCISWAVDQGQPLVVTRQSLEDPEEKLLEEWYDIISYGQEGLGTPTWIGHNVRWDLRFLWQRSMVRGIRPSVDLAIDSKPWDDTVRDTMLMWDPKNYTSLDNLCLALGLEGKGDIDGSKVWDAVQEGRWEEVAEYCRQDVERARQVYQRIAL